MCAFGEEREIRQERISGGRLPSGPFPMSVAARTRAQTMAVDCGHWREPSDHQNLPTATEEAETSPQAGLFGLNSVSPKFELVGYLLKSGRFCNRPGRRGDILETGKFGAWWQPEEERREFVE